MDGEMGGEWDERVDGWMKDGWMMGTRVGREVGL